MTGKEGGRRPTTIGDSVDASIRQIEDNIKKIAYENESQLPEKKNSNTRFNRITLSRKQKCEEKKIYGYFKWQTSEISCVKTLRNVKGDT